MGLPYERFELGRGVDQLRRIGTRYYLTRGGEPEAAARDLRNDLSLVASSGPWRVWFISDSDVVSPLEFEPAVLTSGSEDWNELSPQYSRTPEADAVPLATDGPTTWERVNPGDFPSPRELPPARISRVRVGREDVSFRVNRTGVPTIVRMSWSPGWSAEGARGHLPGHAQRHGGAPDRVGRSAAARANAGGVARHPESLRGAGRPGGADIA